MQGRGQHLCRTGGAAVHDHRNRYGYRPGIRENRLRGLPVFVHSPDDFPGRQQTIRYFFHLLRTGIAVSPQVNHQAAQLAVRFQIGQCVFKSRIGVSGKHGYPNVPHIAVDPLVGYRGRRIRGALHGKGESFAPFLPGAQHGHFQFGSVRTVQQGNRIHIANARNLLAVHCHDYIAFLQTGGLSRGAGVHLHDLHVAVRVHHGIDPHAHAGTLVAGFVIRVFLRRHIPHIGIGQPGRIAGAQAVPQGAVIHLTHETVSHLFIYFAEFMVLGLALVDVGYLLVKAVHGIGIGQRDRHGCGEQHQRTGRRP